MTPTLLCSEEEEKIFITHLMALGTQPANLCMTELCFNSITDSEPARANNGN